MINPVTTIALSGTLVSRNKSSPHHSREDEALLLRADLFHVFSEREAYTVSCVVNGLPEVHPQSQKTFVLINGKYFKARLCKMFSRHINSQTARIHGYEFGIL